MSWLYHVAIYLCHKRENNNNATYRKQHWSAGLYCRQFFLIDLSTYLLLLVMHSSLWIRVILDSLHYVTFCHWSRLLSLCFLLRWSSFFSPLGFTGCFFLRPLQLFCPINCSSIHTEMVIFFYMYCTLVFPMLMSICVALKNHSFINKKAYSLSASKQFFYIYNELGIFSPVYRGLSPWNNFL